MLLHKTTMYITRECLVVPIQAELPDDALLQIQIDILEKVNASSVRGVVIDFSGVNILDSFLGRMVSDTTKMTQLLGAETVVTGLNPGIVASFIDLGVDLNARIAFNLDQGINLLTPEEDFVPDIEEEGDEEENSCDSEDYNEEESLKDDYEESTTNYEPPTTNYEL